MILSRRQMTALFGGAVIGSQFGVPVLAAEAVKFSIQRSSTLLTLLKADGTLESGFAAKGKRPSWHLFDNVVDVMTSGLVDFHADVADAVPVFTQARGAALTFYAAEAASPTAEAIVVREDSPIRRVEDLQGKTVAVHRGSGCHFVLAGALKRVGLGFKDIKAAYLKPADGITAFETDNVDAWVTWDPFLALTQAKRPTRTLCDATGLSSYRRYYLVRNDIAEQQPDLVGVVFDALVTAGRWIKQNPKEAAAKLSSIWGGMPIPVVETVNRRRSYAVEAVTKAHFDEQQTIADTFYEAGLIPHPTNTRQARIWSPRTNRT